MLIHCCFECNLFSQLIQLENSLASHWEVGHVQSYNPPVLFLVYALKKLLYMSLGDIHINIHMSNTPHDSPKLETTQIYKIKWINKCTYDYRLISQGGFKGHNRSSDSILHINTCNSESRHQVTLGAIGSGENTEC